VVEVFSTSLVRSKFEAGRSTSRPISPLSNVIDRAILAAFDWDEAGSELKAREDGELVEGLGALRDLSVAECHFAANNWGGRAIAACPFHLSSRLQWVARHQQAALTRRNNATGAMSTYS
jgi:hypothetical protein